MENSVFSANRENNDISQYKSKRFVDFFKLNNATSRHFFHILNCSYEYSPENMAKFMNELKVKETFASEILVKFKEWRSFLYFLGTYISEIKDFEVLRAMCGWAMIALAYIERERNPARDKTYLDPRDLQVYDVVYKILCYACRQHVSPNIRWFLNVFGDELFEQIMGLIIVDRSWTKDEFVSFLTALAISMSPSDTLSKIEVTENGVTEIKTVVNNPANLLKDAYILPRLMFYPDIVDIVRSLVETIVQTMEITKDTLFKNIFIYILDYHLRKAPPIVKLDTVLHTYGAQPSVHYFRHKGTMAMIVAIFNLSRNEAAALTIIENISSSCDQLYQKWFELKFLGVLLNIRQCVLCDKYFLLRKQEFAESFAILLKLLDQRLLQRFYAKIFQTLWLMNTEVESFKDCWIILFQRLDTKTLVNSSYRILFYISQLSTFDEVARSLMEKIGDYSSSTQTHQKILSVLQHCFGITSGVKLTSIGVAGAALDVVKNSPHLSYQILPKVFNALNEDSFTLESKLRMIDTFMPLIGQLKCIEEVSVIGSCLGKIGAISPLFLPNLQDSEDNMLDSSIIGPKLLLNNKQFLDEFVKRCLSWFSNNDNSTQSDMIGFALQCISKEFNELAPEVRKILDPDLKTEISPFSTSTFALNRSNILKEMPLITAVNSHDEWIVEWFCTLSGFVKKEPYTLLNCLTRAHVGESPAIFADFLPLLLLNCLDALSSPEWKNVIQDEMVAVFSSVGHRVDIKDSCQFIFSFFANVEKQLSILQNKVTVKDHIAFLKKLSNSFIGLKEAVMEAKVNGDDKFPCSVNAAIACSNYYSALEILEKHVIEKDKFGMAIFDRELFSLFQRLYYNVNDVENTQGAYLHIINNSVPSASENILNAEISGNIVEILPMLDKEDRESMSRCVLRLNQPELALAYVKHNFPDMNRDSMRDQFPYAYAVFSVCAMELGRWDLIEEETNEVRGLSQWGPFENSLPVAAYESVQTFPSHLSSILASCRQGQFVKAKQYFDLAQVCATRSLHKTNAEGDRPYNMGFEFVQQLHSLADLQMAWPQLDIFNARREEASVIPEGYLISELLKKWDGHDEFVSFNHRELEPILSVRRNILRSLDLPEKELKFGLTCLLVKSCQLARGDDLHNLVLPLLTEALKNGVSNIDTEEQRALYYSESLDQNKRLLSIPTMNNAIAQFFPKCSDALQLHINNKNLVQASTGRVKPTASTAALPTFRTLKKEEDCVRFLKSAVLLTEMAQNQRETCVAQILRMYEGLESMKASSELFFYRYANFVDFSFKNHNDASIRLLIRLCVETLKSGSTFANELMPRIITIWLDTTPTTTDLTKTQPTIERSSIDPSTMVLNAFGTINRKTFYKAFPLLVSRLAKFSKKDKVVYAAMKRIIVELLIEYPHQCLLLSIAEYRSALVENIYRSKAMTEVYQMAEQSYDGFKIILEAYKFIAASLMDLANKKSGSSQMDLNVYFTEFLRYFNSNAPPPVKNRKTTVKVPIKIPIPLFFAYLDEPFKNVPSNAVTIAQIDQNVAIMQTLARPKRLKLRGSDGQSYNVLCKPEDELRKDARFMDLARMLNVRSKTNKYTRNLAFQIRTFNVIPLQERGGIIEWVPNMLTFGECVDQGGCTNRTEFESLRQQLRAKFSDSKKQIEVYRKIMSLHSLLMANYLRSLSTGPASYYQIQRNYTVSTAFMCATGFIVGLGDRHIGNILIDQINGGCMHVDFCLLFNTGERLNVPEKVPFRLTRNVVDGFGPMGIEGRFRFTFERTISFMQQEKTAALTCLRSFLHDPLIEWKTKEEKNYDEKSVNGKIDLVESRLNGYMHSILCPKTGPFSVRGLVAKQIELAMDEKILSEMFIGWGAYI